jgi:hypothetical protein
LDGFDESIKYRNNEATYPFVIKGYGIRMDEDRIASEISNKAERLLETLNRRNSNIEAENINLLSAIKELIKQRKLKIEADKNRLESLTKKIKIPLKQNPSATVTKVHVSPQSFVRVEKPSAQVPEQYVLDETLLKPILDFIDFQMQSLERTPASIKDLGEEQIRDILLSALNGAFQGNATGETFVKKGKTDIHLKISKGEILIFECKIWKGEKVYLSTIDQLIGYVTWRQNYGVLTMFCRNKDFTNILSQIPGIIQKHSGLKGSLQKAGPSHFVSLHTLPEDSEKTIKVHHLIYNLFAG